MIIGEGSRLFLRDDFDLTARDCCPLFQFAIASFHPESAPSRALCASRLLNASTNVTYSRQVPFIT